MLVRNCLRRCRCGESRIKEQPIRCLGALQPYTAKESRRHKIPWARYKFENRAEYDAALVWRGNVDPGADWTAGPTANLFRRSGGSRVDAAAGVRLVTGLGMPLSRRVA